MDGETCDCPPDKCSCQTCTIDGRVVHTKPNSVFPKIRMSSDHHLNPSIADVGTKLVLFFEFPRHTREIPESFKLMIAGQVEHTTIHKIHQRCESGVYKAAVKLKVHKDAPIPLQNGHVVKFKLTFRTIYDDTEYGSNQEHVTPDTRVYFQSVWSDLRKHDKKLRDDISETLKSQSIQIYIPDGTSPSVSDEQRQEIRYSSYGSISSSKDGRAIAVTKKQENTLFSASLDQPDGAKHEDPKTGKSTIEESPLLYENQSSRFSEQIDPVERLWPDSWELKLWSFLLYRVLRSNNKCIKFINRIFVAPLTNVTVVSLYYQLYLSEIFHTTFWSRAGHYGCMPLVNLFIMVGLAQFRFAGCYVSSDISIFILNGAALFAIFLMVWYSIWGIIQHNWLLGIFMAWPVLFLYLLSNVIFQMIVINSFLVPNLDDCWPYTTHAYGYIRWFHSFQLIKWYYQPLFWIGVFSFLQALSHVAEPMLPPRVNLTAHWMSLSDFMKRNNWGTTFYILVSQAIFGTIDEFLASPRLLPIFMLRLVYTMGYKPKEWTMIQQLVEKCWEFGDPALDFIGTGGADHVDGPAMYPLEDDDLDGRLQTFPSNDNPYLILEEDPKYHNNVDLMKADLRQMGNCLTDEQKEALKNPEILQERTQLLTNFLRHYITLRHRIAKYEIQILAFGPFRSNTHRDKALAEIDNERLARELGNNKGFMKFIKQVRFKFWVMEDDLVRGKFVKYV